MMIDWLTSIAAAVILVRCGCVLNRMKRSTSWPLGLSYVGLSLSSMAVAVAPLYKFEWFGYYSIVMSIAAVLLLDPRLKPRDSR